MKFRTDFVTNSSSSSYLSFNVRNKRLYKCLSELGIRFENVPEGELNDGMEIVLPSGRRAEIDGTENDSYPNVCYYPTVSEWFANFLLWRLNIWSDWSDDINYKYDEDMAFTRELIDILTEHDIIHLDLKNAKHWRMDDDIEADLHEYFGEMDSDLEYASIEHNYGGEGAVGPCVSLYAENGERMSVKFYYPSSTEPESCEGVNFVIHGELDYYENREQIVEYIKEHGGTVTESITAKTDYLICNDIDCESLEMKMARALGIPVLSDLTFFNLFADGYSDDEVEGDEGAEAAMCLTEGASALYYAMEIGRQPVVMQVWKDGKWVTNKELDEESKERIIKEIETAASDGGCGEEDEKASGSKKRGAPILNKKLGRCPVCGEMCDFFTPPIIGEDGNTYHYWCAEIAKINGTVYGSSTRLVKGETIDLDE